MAERSVAQRGASPAVVAGVLVAIAVCWGLVVWPVLDMNSSVTHLMMPMGGAWTAANLAAVFLMWAVMMAAMMLPGALPMVLLYSQLVRRSEPAVAGRRVGIFVLTYLGAWAVFSLAATGVQWGLQSAFLVNPMGVSTSQWLTAGLLVAAGLYQFTPLKQACLTGCRSPLGFLTTSWRPGSRGALVMGLRHGAICVGCCWAIMILAFVGGTMNVLWMVALAAIVTAEKLVAKGAAFDRLLGIALLAGGLTYGLMVL